MTADADLIIVGAGPAGIAAAAEASRLGASAVLIDRELAGGTCLHRGCVPTVATMEIRRHRLDAAQGHRWGIPDAAGAPAWDQIIDARDALVQHLYRGTAHFLGQLRVPYLAGTASLSLAPQPVVLVNGAHGTELKTSAVLLATGAAFSLPKIPGIEASQVWTTDHALGMLELPGRIIVYGGSFIGVEWAQFFRAMGSQVILLEPGAQLLPGEDADIAEALAFLLTETGIEVRTGWPVSSLESDSPAIWAVGPGERIRADRFLVADCRRPRGQALLGEAALRDDGAIRTDDRQQSPVAGVLAAGDVTGGRMLSHWARGQGEVAARNALGETAHFDPRGHARVYHCAPEVAAVGLTAAQAAAQGYEVVVGQADLSFNARAVLLDQNQGLVKVVAERRYGKILGVHMLAPMASEIIGQAALAVRLEGLAEDLAAILPGHPTVSEALADAAREVTRQL
ncbi:MAG: NAD(P)/FAD-dependent oxidoreductase [Thermaerobacter sp.]|nr:NAD(P)/FAD-dependent oxidoreductase [Thermaerobacter sp.]